MISPTTGIRIVIVNPTAVIEQALEIAARYGGSDEIHHLRWVIDQMVRSLAGESYDDFVAQCRAGENGPDTYAWHVGITP